jgi:DNA-binding response OmpR family regulator
MLPYILIVDDDPAVLQGVTTLLEQAGYATRSAATGAETLDMLADAPLPSLIILDIMLPEIDGYTVCRHIRQLPAYVPILMLSARDELTDKVAGLELGADEYVTKPFAPRELIARVRAMLRFAGQQTSAPPAVEAPLVGGPVSLWRAQHRVEVNGCMVELTPREWALLELFLEHPGQVFGRETLLRQIWGDTFLGDSRTVDVQVQRLRAKIEQVPGTPHCIQTVRGFGYRFVVPEPTRPVG